MNARQKSATQPREHVCNTSSKAYVDGLKRS
jgi:hypothetical protein